MSNPDFSVTGMPPEFTVTEDHLAAGQLGGAARISPAHRVHALRSLLAGSDMVSVCDISLSHWETAQEQPLPADVTCRQCRALLPGFLERHPPVPGPEEKDAVLAAALEASSRELSRAASERALWQEEAGTWRAVAAVLLLRLSGVGIPVATTDLTALESALVHGRAVAATIKDDYPDSRIAVSVQLFPLNSGQGKSV